MNTTSYPDKISHHKHYEIYGGEWCETCLQSICRQIKCPHMQISINQFMSLGVRFTAAVIKWALGIQYG